MTYSVSSGTVSVYVTAPAPVFNYFDVEQVLGNSHTVYILTFFIIIFIFDREAHWRSFWLGGYS